MLKKMFVAVACVVLLSSADSLVSAAEKASGQGSQPLQASPFVLPIAKRDSLLNGLQLIVMEQPGAANVTAQLRINSGGLFDLAGKGGLADLTAEMMMRGGGGLTAKNISDMVEQLGMAVKVTVSWDSTDIIISGPKDALENIFDLLNRFVVAPNFDQKELDGLKGQRLAAVKDVVLDEAERLRRKGLEAVFGTHPYGRPLTGTADTVAQIGRADLVNFYSRFYLANNSQLLVQGDVAAEQVTRLARQRLGTWKKGDPVPPNFRQPERLAGNRVLLLDRNEAPAGRAVMTLIGVSHRAQDYFAAVMAVDIFNQLLAQANLGATAKAEARILPGPLTIELSAPPEKVVESVKNITDLMARMQAQPPALEQVEAAKSRLITAMGERLRTNTAIGDVILDIETYGLGRDYVLRYAERVNAVTPSDIQAAARAYLRPDGAVIAIGGPAGKLEADARKLGAVTVVR